MLQKLKENFELSRVQLLTIYIIEVFVLTSVYLIYKSDNLSDRWIDLSYNSTNFVYTQYEIKRKFQGAYWQLATTIGVINHTFVNKGDSYPAIPMCTIQDCFNIQHDNPELDSQYEEIGAYEGVISNKSINSTFGNLGLLLWQFKYSRAGNIQSLEMKIQSSLTDYTMNLHIPVEQFPNPHNYSIPNGNENVSFNPTDIIVSRYFSLTNNSETVSGSVSARINLNKLKQQIRYYNVKMIEKHSGIVYIDNLDQQKPFITKQTSITLGTMTIQFIIMEQSVIIATSYINILYILAFMFLIGLVPIFNSVNMFFKKHITPINSINSILKEKLNYSFNSNSHGKHNLMAVNQQLNNLCGRCEQLPHYSINKQKIAKKTVYEEEFRWGSKLNQIDEKFKAKIVLSQYQTLIYNNKFIIKINQDFEGEKKILKEIYAVVTKQQFFKISYYCVCCSNQQEYYNMLNEILKKYNLKKQQRLIFLRFYYRFHTQSLQELRAKINGQSEKQIESDKDLADDLCYFEGLHINMHDLPYRGPYFNAYYQKAFFERIQNLILSRFLVFVKDIDKNLKYLKQFQLENKLNQIELEIDNLRYQMSRKENNIKQASF